MGKLWLKIAACGGAVLAFIVAMMAVSHFRARREVQRSRAQLVAQGERLRLEELAPLVPSPTSNGVPEFQAAARSFAGINYPDHPGLMVPVSPGRARVAWQQRELRTSGPSNGWPQVETDFTVMQPALAALRAALEKPVLRWDLDYQQGFELQAIHLDSVRNCVRMLATAAICELHRGNSAEAFLNLRSQSALLQRYEGEPLLLAQLVRFGAAGNAIATHWEALQFSGWTEMQLAELQKGWVAIDFLRPIAAALEMERDMTQPGFEHFRRSRAAFEAYVGIIGGGGGSNRDLVDLVEEALKKLQARWLAYPAWKWWDSYEEELFALRSWQAGVEAARQMIATGTSQPASDRLKQRCAEMEASDFGKKGEFAFTDREGSTVRRFLDRAVAVEVQRRLLVAALALARYRLRYGRYPGDLAALAPEFLAQVPRDLIDGKPLRYRLEGETFILYSIGLDGEDNGGDANAAEPKFGTRAWNGRDWVWPAPATPAEVAAAETKPPPQGRRR